LQTHDAKIVLLENLQILPKNQNFGGFGLDATTADAGVFLKL
jgi:hypothetical protein